MSEQTQTFRIHDEPMSFRDRAFIALCQQLVLSEKRPKGRQVSCDIQAAWDLAEAMNAWREKMTKEK